MITRVQHLRYRLLLTCTRCHVITLQKPAYLIEQKDCWTSMPFAPRPCACGEPQLTITFERTDQGFELVGAQ